MAVLLKLAALVLPLGLDTFAVAAALGIAGLAPRERLRASLLARTHGWAVIGLGVSISLDELAIGFTIGLLKLPIVLVLLLIGLQAFLATQLGLRLGSRLSDAVREGAERLAGVALAGLGLFLLLEKLIRLT